MNMSVIKLAIGLPLSFLVLSASQVIVAQEKGIDGLFGVSFNTDRELVMGALKGRSSPAAQYIAEQMNSPISSYTITPPNPSKYLKGYSVFLAENIFKICGTANKAIVDRDNETYVGISKDDALFLYDVFDKKLMLKYGGGLVIGVTNSNQSDYKAKNFVLGSNQMISLEYSYVVSDHNRQKDFEVEVCYWNGDVSGSG